MNALLWIVQILLATLFFFHSRLLLNPDKNVPEERKADMKFIFDLPPRFRTFLGVAEILAAIGLIVPGLTGIVPELTALAALGLAIIMASSIVFHTRRGEASRRMILNFALLGLSLLVAYGRAVAVPL